MISEVRTKIRPQNYDEEVRKLQSIDKPDSIYPKILELPSEDKQKKRRARFDPLTQEFSDEMETFQ